MGLFFLLLPSLPTFLLSFLPCKGNGYILALIFFFNWKGKEQEGRLETFLEDSISPVITVYYL